MSYLTETIENVIEMVTDNYNAEDFDGMTPDSIREKIYEDAWIDDSVTGNASGSYYFNSYKSKETVLNEIDTIKEALTEFCTPSETIAEKFLNEEWEFLDVTARCYVLGEAVGEAYKKLDYDGFFDIDDDEYNEGGEEE